MAKYFFTLSAGRTGTAWLASFLEGCSGKKCIHEPYGIDELGVVMPDIKTLLAFNHRGNNDHVRQFWRTKFSTINGRPFYAETNHTLGKCGLIENLAQSSLRADSKVIILRRNVIKQCVSYLVRHDFANSTIAWQWYLWPNYTKKLVNYNAFAKHGDLGAALWYCYEMTARQDYYKKIYSDRIDFIDVNLDDVVRETGGHKFFTDLEMEGNFTLPPPKNENRKKPSPQLIEHVTNLVNGIEFNSEEIVEAALSRGFSFEF